MVRQTKPDRAKSSSKKQQFQTITDLVAAILGSLWLTSSSMHTIASICHCTMHRIPLPFRASTSEYIGLQGEWLSEEP